MVCGIIKKAPEWSGVFHCPFGRCGVRNFKEYGEACKRYGEQEPVHATFVVALIMLLIAIGCSFAEAYFGK